MDSDLAQLLADYRKQHERLSADLALASRTGDQARLRQISQRFTQVENVLTMAERLQSVSAALTEAQRTADDAADPELQAMAKQEIPGLEQQRQRLEEQLEILIQPSDPQDEKDVLVEIRAGAGGDEAALFAAELFRMYARFAERQGWKTQLLSASHTGIGGLKEVIFEITGQEVFRSMRYESGVHRVQRVPDTEKSGRVHTSTVTVAVVPMAEEAEFFIDPKDLKIIASTSSGAGGQSVNTTYSAIRMTHIPTGVTVSMQDERSQTQNRLKAMAVMRSRLLARQEEEKRAHESSLRKSQIGSGDRSEKIRTYNFPQDRLTDHRIGLSLHGLDRLLDGDILELLQTLHQAEGKKRTATP